MQLIKGLTPVPAPSDPLFYDIHHGQIQQFEQGRTCREDRPILCYFPQQVVKVLYGIGGINQLSDLAQILKVCGKLRPVIPLGSNG